MYRQLVAIPISISVSFKTRFGQEEKKSLHLNEFVLHPTRKQMFCMVSVLAPSLVVKFLV